MGKLLRSGGLLRGKYTSTTSICDLKSGEWLPLPPLNYKRHGHRTMCIQLSNQSHGVNIGGFDAKGKTIKKSEMMSIECIRSHTQTNEEKQDLNDSQQKKKECWNVMESVQLPIGIADFGQCYDKIHDRIYICGG